MKAMIFSDLHAHNYQEFAAITEDVNTRFLDCMDFMDRLTARAAEFKPDAILFGGDVYHLKNNVDSRVIKMTIEAFAELAKVAPVYMCAGNHDYKGWNQDPALIEILSGFVFNIVHGEHCEIGNTGWAVDIFDFRRDIEEVKSLARLVQKRKKTIALFHQDIEGAFYPGNNVAAEVGLNAAELGKKFDFSFVGHNHNAHVYGHNVISIGAPLQHNFGDTNEKRGHWELDTDAQQLDFIENTESPQFITLRISSDAQWVPGRQFKDFYRINVEGPDIPEVVSVLKWKRILMESGSAKKERAGIKLSDTTEDVIAKYVKAKNSDLDEEILINLGKELL